jgi:hypothetical protein
VLELLAQINRASQRYSHAHQDLASARWHCAGSATRERKIAKRRTSRVRRAVSRQICRLLLAGVESN